MAPTPAYKVYVLKTDASKDNDYWKPRVYQSLKEGFARFGWGLRETGDLRLLQKKVNKGLRDIEKDAWRSRFLLKIKPGDYVICLNVPSFGKCTLARVSGTYDWREWDKDYNHGVSIDRETIREFDRNDRDVDPQLSNSLKLMGRYWTIKHHTEFEQLLTLLEGRGLSGKQATTHDRRARLVDEIAHPLKEIASRIRNTHPKKQLEELVSYTLVRIPGIENVERKSGSADHGADIVFEFQSGLPFGDITKVEKCGVQVKAYEGELDDQKAIEDIERVLDFDRELTCAMIITTAERMTEAFGEALEKLRARTEKPIGVLLGSDLAAWFIRYGLD